MKPCFSLLSQDEIQQIHLATLEILENIGVTVNSPQALTILDKGGATVDGTRRLVKIPSHLVEETLRSAPKRIVLCGRKSRNDIKLENGRVHFGMGSTTLHIIDPTTWERKTARREYIAQAVRVADALPNIKFAEQFCCALDCQRNVQDLHEIQAVLANTEKPAVGIAYGPETARDFLKMASLAAGGMDELRKRPILAVFCEPVSPLQHDEKAMDVLIEVAKEGTPVLYGSAVQSAATGPMTLPGTLAIANAEVLGGLIVSQLVRKGTPFIHGVISTIIDIRTGIMCYGAPEFALINAMAAQLSQWYGLPFFGTGGTSDSKAVDEQAVCEAMMTALPAVLAGTNLIHDIGYIESGLTGSFEMLAIGNEIADMCFRIARGVSVNDETLATDVIREVGPGGHFLGMKHTLRHADEHWIPTLIDRNTHQTWKKSGAKEMVDRAREIITKLLKEHVPDPLPKEVTEGMDQIIKEATKRTLQ